MRVILPILAVSTVFLSGFAQSVPVMTDAAAELLDSPLGIEMAAATAGTGADASAFQISLFKPQSRLMRKLDVEHVSPWVDVVTLLPGERFPLKALTAAGLPMTATWRATAGTLAYGDKMAVWTSPLEAGSYTVTAHGLMGGQKVTRTLSMIVTVPTGNVKNGRLNGYPIGTYPKGFGPKPTLVANRGSRDGNYTVPAGFAELNKSTFDTPVSTHYRLGDFAGKDSAVGGKKYLFVEPRLIEKIERVIATLNAAGYPASKLEIMSGFRSPQLNKAIGNVTSLSRHTYGDAADMLAQDFNRDKRVDVVDGQILLAAVTKVDKETDLVGGASLYPPTGSHSYFVHTDTRGALVRW